MSTESIAILLAVHNGARFIEEQIRSIQAQTARDWTLIVRDDASADHTVPIIRGLADADPRIELLPLDGRRLGSAGTFGALLAEAHRRGADYVLFADHDDVWLPHKVEAEMRALKAAERSMGRDTPLLVHTDLEVVDAELRSIHPSYREFQGVLYSRSDPLSTFALHNAVVGCTSAFNRALMDVALPLPHGVQHDWWIAQCAAATGTVVDLPEATVRYRQHGGNEIGARGKHAFVRTMFARPRRFVSTTFAGFAADVRQTHALLARLRERPGIASDESVRRVADYCSAFDGRHGVMKRWRALHRSRVHPRRLVSHPILYGLAAIYPWVEHPSRDGVQ